MPFYCLQCGSRMRSHRCRCGSHDGERVPPLDGYIELEPEEGAPSDEETFLLRQASLRERK